MLSDVLTHAPWLAPAALVLVVATAPVAGRWLTAHRSVTAGLLLVAVLGIAALTLSPQSFPSRAITCSWGWPFVNSSPEESLANAVLFLPAAFLAALLWRRPVLAVLGVSLFSAVIEAVQALVPVIGRACDSRDWMTDTAGAIAGGALAVLALAWSRHRAAKRGLSRGDDTPPTF